MATSASAAVSAEVHDGKLWITAAGEAVVLTESGNVITVASPEVDGCRACAVSANTTIAVQLSGGGQFDGSTLARPMVVGASGGGDTVRTGAGDDTIAVEGVTNQVHAGAGNDVITGAGLLHGEGGDDLINGGGTLFGGPGNDHLTGLFALAMDGGTGRDVIEGGRAGDTIEARDGEPDTVTCGDGPDSVRADRADTLAGDCEHRDLPPVETATPTPTPTVSVTATATATPAETVVAAPTAIASGSPPSATRDVVAPAVTMSLVKRVKRARFARSGVVADVRCSEACSVVVEVRVDARDAKRLKLPRLLARGTGTGRVTARPGAPVRRRLLRAQRVVSATVVVHAVDGAGNARTVRRALELSR